MSRRKTTSRLAGLDFKEEFEVFSANVNRAARAFYYNIALNEYALADDKNICILNEAAQFWNDFRDSTVVTVFILLGRIFDKPQGARNIDKLLQIAENSNHFTADSLRARKMDGHATAPDWLDDYMLHVHILGKADFDDMRSFVGDIRSEWENIEPIRHKFIAHQEIFTNKADAKNILERSDAKVIESIILKLFKLDYILREASLNGRKPDYNHNPDQMKGYTYSNLNKLLGLLSAGCNQAIGETV